MGIGSLLAGGRLPFVLVLYELNYEKQAQSDQAHGELLRRARAARDFGESTSYEIKQALESSIQNFWPVPHTTAYEEPARLATAGYLSAKQEPGGRRRSVYSLTDAAVRRCAPGPGSPSAASPQLRDELMLKVFAGADPEPLLEPRIAHHRAKLEELRGYLELVRVRRPAADRRRADADRRHRLPPHDARGDRAGRRGEEGAEVVC